MTTDAPGRQGLLVLVRHGQSTDNDANLFSGLRDPELTQGGVGEARLAGHKLKGVRFDIAFTSLLRRARRSLDLMLVEMGTPALPIETSAALNERDYGRLAGLSKEEARAIWGAEQVRRWRKSYDAVPPGGESLAMTADRMLPFWREAIDPRVRNGAHVLVVAHGNSLRSIIKHIERLPAAEMDAVHLATSQIISYRMARDGAVTEKHSILVAPDPAP